MTAIVMYWWENVDLKSKGDTHSRFSIPVISPKMYHSLLGNISLDNSNYMAESLSPLESCSGPGSMLCTNIQE